MGEATTQSVIQMEGICKGYQMGAQALQVLKNIDFHVQEGEFVAVLGPSGSGKSTLMNIIGCMDTADTGEYFISGSAVHAMSQAELANLRNAKIGFIFQKYHLIPQYSVLQNIIMPLLIRGIPRRQAQQDAMETIEMLGMQERLAHKPSELSGGQQQRVAVARALVGHPRLLLADEPTGALDSTTGQDVLGLFKKLNQAGHTIIMITHDLTVAAHAQRIVKIIDGELFI
ncbi:ABC transporter ATP-binding protein [Oscillospiraceae bacterium MB08-C2-2]|nr:ABC transporter ATP-binding protein [Oscillospiraceae bacterium MB08-C2-2]